MKQEIEMTNNRYLVGILLLMFLMCSNLIACQKPRRPSRYLIPQGYVGWVKVYFKVKDAQPLPIEDGHYLLKFLTTGKIETSSEIEYGVTPADDYYYYSGDTRHPLQLAGSDGSGMIWAEYNGERFDSNNQLIETYEGFFVGTELDFHDFGCQRDENGQPKTGPVDKRTAKKCNSQ